MLFNLPKISQQRDHRLANTHLSSFVATHLFSHSRALLLERDDQRIVLSSNYEPVVIRSFILNNFVFIYSFIYPSSIYLRWALSSGIRRRRRRLYIGQEEEEIRRECCVGMEGRKC